jgi:hypothetical protein
MERSETNIYISWNRGSMRTIPIDSEMTVKDLKHSISLLRGMSTGTEIDSDHLAVEVNGEPLADDTTIASVGAGSVLSIRSLEKNLQHLFERDSDDLAQLTKIFRDLTRDDIPSAQQRHEILEHQRRASTAVTEAFVRSRGASLILGTSTDPIREEEQSNSESQAIAGVRKAFEPLIEILESSGNTSEEQADFAISELFDGISAAADFEMIDVQPMDCETLGQILKARPVDRLRAAATVVSLCEHHARSVTKETHQAIDDLRILLVENADGERIAAAIIDLIGCVVRGYRSPASLAGTGLCLLPDPSEKASLSPEILQWTQGLKPQHRNTRG